MVGGNTYTANRTVTRDITLPAINFIGGATSFTDVSVTTQVAILFREAVTDLELEDFFVEAGSLSNLSSSDGGVSWIADFTPNQSTNNPNSIITLGNDYTYVSTGLAPVVSDVPVVWSDRSPEVVVSNTNDLSLGTGIGSRSATTGLNFPVESGSSVSFDTPYAGGSSSTNIGISYLERQPGKNPAIDYSLQNANGRLRALQASSVYGQFDGVNAQNVRFSRRGERVSIFINNILRFTFDSFLVGPLYPQVLFNDNTPINNTRIIQDVTLTSVSYAVQTQLGITGTNVNGNTITIDFDQSLNAASLAFTNLELLVGGASIFISDSAVSGNQLTLTYSGPALADGSLATLSYTPIGGVGLTSTNGASVGAISTIFANGNQPFTFSSAASYALGSSQADTFTVDYKNISSGGGDDTIYWGDARGTGGNLFTGGTGRDTYIKNPPVGTNIGFSARGEYFITDFETGTVGDIIDVSRAIAYDSSAGHDLTDFVHVISNGTDTLLRFANPLRSIEDGALFTSALRLQGVVTTLSQLIADGNLIVE